MASSIASTTHTTYWWESGAPDLFVLAISITSALIYMVVSQLNCGMQRHPHGLRPRSKSVDAVLPARFGQEPPQHRLEYREPAQYNAEKDRVNEVTVLATALVKICS